MNTQPDADGSSRGSKLLLIKPPRNGSLLNTAELVPWLEQGWSVIEVSPRIMQDGARMLVVLGKEEPAREPIPLAPDKEPTSRREFAREGATTFDESIHAERREPEAVPA